MSCAKFHNLCHTASIFWINLLLRSRYRIQLTHFIIIPFCGIFIVWIFKTLQNKTFKPCRGLISTCPQSCDVFFELSKPFPEQRRKKRKKIRPSAELIPVQSGKEFWHISCMLLKYNWIEPPAKQAIVVKSLHRKTTGYKTCDPRRLSSGSRDSLNALLIILSIINMSFCTSDSAHTLQLSLTFTCEKLSDTKETETIALKLNQRFNHLLIGCCNDVKLHLTPWSSVGCSWEIWNHFDCKLFFFFWGKAIMEGTKSFFVIFLFSNKKQM